MPAPLLVGVSVLKRKNTKPRSDIKPMVGLRFGRLVVEKLSNRPGRNKYWSCVCDCGQKTDVQGGTLRANKTLSCGCLHREIITTHGMEKSPEYMAWAQMRARCNNPRSQAYRLYGERGIKVCPRWDSFAAFFADMGPKQRWQSIDRIDNNGNYEPGNCRWTDAITQCNNKRTNHRLLHEGTELTLTEWARKIGLSPITLSQRLRKGWTVGRALTTPADLSKSRHYFFRRRNMSFRIIDSGAGTFPAISTTDTVQGTQLGTIVRIRQDDGVALVGAQANTAGEAIYLKGVASTVVGSLVTYDPGLATTALAPATGGVGPVAVALSANVAAQFGWYQISGVAAVRAPNAMTPGADVFMLAATPGSVDDAQVNGEQVLGAKVTTTTGTPAAGLALITISRPVLQGQIV